MVTCRRQSGTSSGYISVFLAAALPSDDPFAPFLTRVAAASALRERDAELTELEIIAIYAETVYGLAHRWIVPEEGCVHSRKIHPGERTV